MPKQTHVRPQGGIISFFSGCGILDLGFERAGFRTWLSNEVHRPFAEAYEYARREMRSPTPVRGHVVRDSIESFFQGRRRDLLEVAMQDARAEDGLVGFVGGPPCPDFSIAGKQAGHVGDHGRLTQDYFDLIGMLRPDFFLFENVKGLKSTKKHLAFFKEVCRRVREDGYEITERTVNSIDYGAPQDRNRVIVVGFHRDAFPGAAKAMAEGYGWEAHATHLGALSAAGWPAEEALVRDPETGEIIPTGRDCPEALDRHLRELTLQHWFERNGVETHANGGDVFQVRSGLERMRQVLEGDTSRKSFKRLHRWRYSPTVAYGNNEVHLHPFLDRRLSAAEAMALQSLPREFELPPDMTLSDKFKTIGNGVPFLLAQALALSIRDAIGTRVAQPVARDPARGRTPLPEPVPDLLDALVAAEPDGFVPAEIAAAVETIGTGDLPDADPGLVLAEEEALPKAA